MHKNLTPRNSRYAIPLCIKLINYTEQTTVYISTPFTTQITLSWMFKKYSIETHMSSTCVNRSTCTYYPEGFLWNFDVDRYNLARTTSCCTLYYSYASCCSRNIGIAPQKLATHSSLICHINCCHYTQNFTILVLSICFRYDYIYITLIK